MKEVRIVDLSTMVQDPRTIGGHDGVLLTDQRRKFLICACGILIIHFGVGILIEVM